MADTLQIYLQMAGRLRERDDLTAWVREKLPRDRLTVASCGSTLNHAWTLFTRGQGVEAIQMVLGLFLGRIQVYLFQIQTP